MFMRGYVSVRSLGQEHCKERMCDGSQVLWGLRQGMTKRMARQIQDLTVMYPIVRWQRLFSMHNVAQFCDPVLSGRIGERPVRQI